MVLPVVLLVVFLVVLPMGVVDSLCIFCVDSRLIVRAYSAVQLDASRASLAPRQPLKIRACEHAQPMLSLYAGKHLNEATQCVCSQLLGELSAKQNNR